MTDTMSPARRSAHMSRIGSGLRKNALERRVHGALCGARIPHRMYPPVRPSADVEVQTEVGPLYLHIDGCFWHACPDHYRPPKDPRASWGHDLEEEQRARDAARARASYPWIRLWEHQLRSRERWVDDGALRAREVLTAAIRSATTGLRLSPAPWRGRVPTTLLDLGRAHVGLEATCEPEFP